jgi:uncharacterized protein
VGALRFRLQSVTIELTELTANGSKSEMINYETLETIHRLLRLKSELMDQLARCPRSVKQAEISAANLEKVAEEAKTNWQNCKKEADNKQMTLKQREARIEQMKAKRNTCESNKEFQILNEQIAADNQANSVLADEILEMLERAENLNAQVASAREHTLKGQKDLERIRGEVAEKQKKLEVEVAEVEKRLQQNERVMTGEVLSEYRRRVVANGENALASTDGETCGNCHQLLNAQMLSELYQKKPVFCKGCGSIMYLVRSHASTSSEE